MKTALLAAIILLSGYAGTHAQSGFTISASPKHLTIDANQNALFKLTITPSGGFTASTSITVTSPSIWIPDNYFPHPVNQPYTISGISGVVDEAARNTMLLSTLPNPMQGSGYAFLRVPSAGHVTATLYDVRGRELGRVADGNFEPDDHLVPIDLSNRPAGSYLLCMMAAGRSETAWIVK